MADMDNMDAFVGAYVNSQVTADRQICKKDNYTSCWKEFCAWLAVDGRSFKIKLSQLFISSDTVVFGTFYSLMTPNFSSVNSTTTALGLMPEVSYLEQVLPPRDCDAMEFEVNRVIDNSTFDILASHDTGSIVEIAGSKFNGVSMPWKQPYHVDGVNNAIIAFYFIGYLFIRPHLNRNGVPLLTSKGPYNFPCVFPMSWFL